MFGLSRLVAFALVFFMGFGLAAGLFIGIPAAVIASYSLRDLENTNLISIPDEKFLRPDAPVDIFDLNGIELYREIQELQSFGDDLTLALLEERYGIIFDEKLDLMLTDEAMNMPLYRLLSMEGVYAVLENVFIGDVEGYECYSADETPGGDPNDSESYWVNHDGERISELEEIIADFNLADFISGNINTDSILHGDLTLADILGYRYNEEQNCWIDGNGDKVSGIMAVFADCTLDTVDDKINKAQIGEILSYTKVDTGEVDEEGNPIYRWETVNSQTGESEPVHSFMAAVADESIDTLGGLFKRITVGQIIPEEQRKNGIMSIIPPDTTIDQIGAAVNESVSNTPLQFFINQGLVDFNVEMYEGQTVAQFLDVSSDPTENITMGKEGKNYMITFKAVSEGEEGYEDFLKNESYYGDVWTMDENGNYKVPAWRTKLLSQSFAYIIGFMANSVAEESEEPVIAIDYNK